MRLTQFEKEQVIRIGDLALRETPFEWKIEEMFTPRMWNAYIARIENAVQKNTYFEAINTAVPLALFFPERRDELPIPYWVGEKLLQLQEQVFEDPGEDFWKIDDLLRSLRLLKILFPEEISQVIRQHTDFIPGTHQHIESLLRKTSNSVSAWSRAASLSMIVGQILFKNVLDGRNPMIEDFEDFISYQRTKIGRVFYASDIHYFLWPVCLYSPHQMKALRPPSSEMRQALSEFRTHPHLDDDVLWEMVACTILMAVKTEVTQEGVSITMSSEQDKVQLHTIEAPPTPRNF